MEILGSHFVVIFERFAACDSKEVRGIVLSLYGTFKIVNNLFLFHLCSFEDISTYDDLNMNSVY